MGMKSLAEAIILQSMSDLWSEEEREGSLNFFKGEDFTMCADMAGMDLSDQVKLLNVVNKAVKHGARHSKPTAKWQRQSKSMPKKIMRAPAAVSAAI